MPTPNWTRAVIALFAIIVLAAAALTGDSLDDHFLQWISGAAAVVVLLLLVFDKWAWRWPLIRRFSEANGRPVLHGTWKGVLTYERDANDQPGSIPFYMAVDQTFSTVRVRSFVSTSVSRSLTAVIEVPERTDRRLIFVWHSQAPHHARDDNRPHEGTSVIQIVGTPVQELQGSYYTDRLRRGAVSLGEHADTVAESFDNAERLTFKRSF